MNRLLLMLMLLCPMLAQAQESLTVHVEEAGTFQERAEAAGLSEDVTNLTITGVMNGTDFKFLRDLLHIGWPPEPYPNIAIDSLDIASVRIVAGGTYYGGTYISVLYTENDVLGQNMFVGAPYLRYINLPTTIKSIGKNALAGIYTLKEATIPKGVLYIGEGAFSSSGIEKVTLSHDLQMVGAQCFADCQQLKQVEVNECYTPPAFGYKAFDGLDYNNIELLLTSSWKEMIDNLQGHYEEADGWKNFTHMATQYIDPTGISAVKADRPAPTDNRYYRLDGTEANPPGKGVYIHNGQKVVVK